MALKNYIDDLGKENPNVLIFPLGNHKLVKQVIEALNFKGGESSLNSLKIATMLEEELIKQGLHSARIFGLAEKDESDEKIYKITNLADRWLQETTAAKRKIIGEKFLEIEPFLDLIFRMINSPDKTIKIGEIEKAIYIILNDVREEIRKEILASFLNFGVYANLFEEMDEKSNPRIKLTSTGDQLFNEFHQKKKAGKKDSSSRSSSNTSAGVETFACNECGREIQTDYSFCPYCATELKRSCQNCGKELQAGWKMCPFCGTPN